MNLSLPKTNEALTFADEADISGYAREGLYALRQAGIISDKPGKNRHSGPG
jgi:hypothetical protein